MLENCKTAKERWGGVSDIIDRWIAERQELIVLYCQLSSVSREADSEGPCSRNIQKLCQLLVDYVSAGHFEVYEQLLKEADEFNDGGLELAKRLFPKIQETTEIALDFNDQYDNSEHGSNLLDELPDKLSLLGEALEERFVLEDQLIECLHNSHKELVA
ncbi:sigma D regulator [Litoribacillus peritrichatus]|uniref:Sigma D regulator n=1 Tax=Litoribacillus peritrichatus TaxID=718191 RepID=A0ABP7NDV5_9GAMM